LTIHLLVDDEDILLVPLCMFDVQKLRVNLMTPKPQQ
jgi:hypothetical protein